MQTSHHLEDSTNVDEIIQIIEAAGTLFDHLDGLVAYKAYHKIAVQRGYTNDELEARAQEMLQKDLDNDPKYAARVNHDERYGHEGYGWHLLHLLGLEEF